MDALEQQILAQADALREQVEDPEPRRFGEADEQNDQDEKIEEAKEHQHVETSEVESRGPRRGPNTGVKGVIEDFKEKQHADSVKREDDSRRLAEKIKKMALTVSPDPVEEEDIDLEDDVFLQQYQAKLLQDIRQNKNRPVFGVLTGVNDEGFLRAVDKENPSVTVIVHLTDDRLQQSRRMNACLVEVAERFAYAKFVWYSAQSAGFEVDVLPTILVYRGGQLQQSLVHTEDEIGTQFSADDVEGLLLRYGALTEAYRSSDSMRQTKPKSVSKLIFAQSSPLDDDED